MWCVGATRDERRHKQERAAQRERRGMLGSFAELVVLMR